MGVSDAIAQHVHGRMVDTVTVLAAGNFVVKSLRQVFNVVISC
ncbi:hypothetical protein QE390_000962 [Siphonobacter sp. SORGH_AS 1065]|nr:hypothetical protein [Siphonobacter sp. SORGH_AS_1065]